MEVMTEWKHSEISKTCFSLEEKNTGSATKRSAFHRASLPRAILVGDILSEGESIGEGDSDDRPCS